MRHHSQAGLLRRGVVLLGMSNQLRVVEGSSRVFFATSASVYSPKKNVKSTSSAKRLHVAEQRADFPAVRHKQISNLHTLSQADADDVVTEAEINRIVAASVAASEESHGGAVASLEEEKIDAEGALDVGTLFSSRKDAVLSSSAAEIADELLDDTSADAVPAAPDAAAAAEAPAADLEDDDSPITASPSDADDTTQSKHLVQRFPALAQQYHASNTAPLAEILVDSGKVVHWCCNDCGHLWRQAVFLRCILKTPCPACEAKTKLTLGQVNKLLMREWDTTRNDPFVDVESIPVTSSMNASWVCSVCRTSFVAKVKNRLAGKSRCPTCSVATLQHNSEDASRSSSSSGAASGDAASRATSHEAVMLEWHPVRNGDLKPGQVSPTARVWWLCSSCGHEWEASVTQRIRRKRAANCALCKASH